MSSRAEASVLIPNDEQRFSASILAKEDLTKRESLLTRTKIEVAVLPVWNSSWKAAWVKKG
jgi:hypothetical protein